jgi:Tol biopolymer transport system component
MGRLEKAMQIRLVATHAAIVIAAALALSSSITAQSGHELFQQALSKERAEGKLQDAIALYQRIIDVAGTDHGLAARALLQLGRCYEALGNTEARAAYERLIARYPDQTELVAQARARLTALVRTASSTGTPVSMTIQALPDVREMTLAVTSDASKAIVWDLSKGQNLALHDFSNRQRRLLTDLEWSMGLIGFPVWSPDGRRVAYQQNTFRPGSELRVTTLDGRSSVVHHVDVYGGVQPVGWTPDGATLIAVVGRPDKTWAVGTLPAIGGEFTPLRSFGWTYNPRDGSPSVSPDGRFIAYLEGDRGVRDVHVVSLDGRHAYRLTADPSDDFAPVWSPDSRHLAFKSNRLGSVSVWILEVKDGQPVGQAVKLKDRMDSTQVIDWTERGIVYVESFATSDLFTVPMDPVEGRPTGSPSPISYWRTGHNVSPVWSPDGDRLAFVSSTPAEPNRRFVVVLPREGGQAREFLIPTTSWPSQPDLRWFGDGRGLGLLGQDTRGALVIFRLRLDTGDWDTTPFSGKEAPLPLMRTEWNHDGGRFYLTRPSLGGGRDGGIFERGLNDDAERIVYRAEPRSAIVALQFSPDRKSLAFSQSQHEGNTTTISIITLHVETGEARSVLVERIAGSDGLQEVHLLGWTPSGDLLVHKLSGTMAQRLAGNGGSETIVVPVNGGAPRSFAIPRIGTTGRAETSRQIVAKWSPDGRTMVVGRAGRGGETFIIENPLAGVRTTTASRR